jgi:hypothetical protein
MYKWTASFWLYRREAWIVNSNKANWDDALETVKKFERFPDEENE